MTPDRANRFGELIRAALADVVLTKMRDPRVSMVSVTEARVSRDLGFADVYVSSLAATDAKARQDLLNVLNRAAGFLRSAIAKRHDLRTTPRLRFHYDELVEKGPRLEALIARAVHADQSHPGADAPQQPGNEADHGP